MSSSVAAGGAFRRNAVRVMQTASVSQAVADMRQHAKLNKMNSQLNFSQRLQTVIVFDWDDTLFPTTWSQDDLSLDWNEPLSRQIPEAMNGLAVADVEQKLKACEQRAAEVLSKASDLAHVAIVTLASTGWVDMSCQYLFPNIGQLLKDLDIPIIYAQEKAAGAQKAYKKTEFQSNEELERYYGIMKGQAISDEVDKFYSQYEGQSWKNILSIGDSSFERYGLLAATSAYMQGQSGLQDAEVWNPTEEGHWQKVTKEGQTKKLRAKCCKLVDSPDVEELAIELEMVTKWLEDMVHLDAGFDLDLEGLVDETQLAIIEDVLRGRRPVDDLAALQGSPDGA